MYADRHHRSLSASMNRNGTMTFPSLKSLDGRWHALTLGVMSLITACSTTAPTVRPATDIAGAQSAAEVGAPTPWSGADELLVYSSQPAAPADLENESLYRILAAEFAGQREQLPFAVEQYAKLAASTTDPNIAERAAKISVFALDYGAASTAAERWVATAPTNLDARQLAAAMHIRHGEAEPAIAHLKYVLAHDHSGRGDKLKMIANL